ncbi:MAG: Wzz/FepE/Etk N-terminal domain-containing protein [Eubacteriales bacterium]
MEFTLKDVGEIIKKSWILILALPVVATALGFVISSYLIQKEYQATAMMIVSTSVQSQESNSSGMTLSEYDLNARLVSSYSVLCKSDRILSQVRDKLKIQINLEALSDKIDVTSKEDTDIISLAVTDVSPQMAQSIANTLVDVFKNEVAGIMKMDNVQVIDYAALPDKPISPNVLVSTVISGLIGLVAALVISALRYMMDDTVKESDVISSIMGLPVIGNVPKMN